MLKYFREWHGFPAVRFIETKLLTFKTYVTETSEDRRQMHAICMGYDKTFQKVFGFSHDMREFLKVYL